MKAIASDYPNLSVGCRKLDIKEVLDGLREGTIEIAVSYNLNLEADVSFRGVRSFPPYAIYRASTLSRKTRGSTRKAWLTSR